MATLMASFCMTSAMSAVLTTTRVSPSVTSCSLSVMLPSEGDADEWGRGGNRRYPKGNVKRGSVRERGEIVGVRGGGDGRRLSGQASPGPQGRHPPPVWNPDRVRPHLLRMAGGGPTPRAGPRGGPSWATINNKEWVRPGIAREPPHAPCVGVASGSTSSCCGH